MKRFIFAILCLCLCVPAGAEVYLPDLTLTAQASGGVSGEWGDAFLTAWETAEPAPMDIYAHATTDCYGLEGRVTDPDAKHPCPICMSEVDSGKIAAVERGGTVIVRIPTGWMEKQNGFVSPFFGAGSREYTGPEAEKRLAADLGGQAYAEFLREWKEKGSAEAVTWDADIAETGDLMEMNKRRIGNAVYFVIRPSGKVKDSLKVNLSLFRGVAEAGGDVLRMYRDADWNSKKHTLKLEKDDADAVFTGEYSGCKLTLYETELGVYAAVVHKPDAGDEDLFYLWLRIGDRENIVMNGYMNKKKGVYCCVLTAGEAQAIMDGGEVVIENAPRF